MTETDSLFLNTLTDLEERIASGDPYEILGASALLRKLLLDDFPLVDQVNRHRQVKLVFEICESSPYVSGAPEPTVWSVQDGLDPETARPGKLRKSVKRDGLLSTVLMLVEGRKYTVRDVVLFEAHVMGGVHSRAPEEEKEKALQTIDSEFRLGGGLRTSLRQLQAIGRVVLRGLAPLRAAVSGA